MALALVLFATPLSEAASALVLIVASGLGPGCFCNPCLVACGPILFFCPVASALVLFATPLSEAASALVLLLPAASALVLFASPFSLAAWALVLVFLPVAWALVLFLTSTFGHLFVIFCRSCYPFHL